MGSAANLGKVARPFTGGEGGFPGVGAKVDFGHIYAVEPMLEMIATDNHEALVPFAGFFGVGDFGVHQVIHRRQGVFAFVVGSGAVLIDDLKFDAQGAVIAGDFDDAVFQAAVAAGGDFEIEAQLEAVEGFVEGDVAAAAPGFVMEGGVVDVPTGGEFLAAKLA